MTMKKLATAAFAVAAFATLSIAASGDAFARGGGGRATGGGMNMHSIGSGTKFVGSAKTIGRGKLVGARRHGHRFYGRGYAYNTCWKWTPAGRVNICLYPY
jgi:hypothetical protein